VSSFRGGHGHLQDEGYESAERVLKYQDDQGVIWDHAEDPYDFDRPFIEFYFDHEMLFVPPGAKVTLDDGREVPGPLFLTSMRIKQNRM
jgi:hypothetical protein